MRLEDAAVTLSPSDLMRFQGCAYATALDLRYLRGESLEPVDAGEEIRLVREMGDAHERTYLDELLKQDRTVSIVDTDNLSFADAVDQTADFLRQGPDCVYQVALRVPPWAGYADFLVRVARPSRLGDYSYEVIDTKLKRSPDPMACPPKTDPD